MRRAFQVVAILALLLQLAWAGGPSLGGRTGADGNDVSSSVGLLAVEADGIAFLDDMAICTGHGVVDVPPSDRVDRSHCDLCCLTTSATLPSPSEEFVVASAPLPVATRPRAPPLPPALRLLAHPPPARAPPHLA